MCSPTALAFSTRSSRSIASSTASAAAAIGGRAAEGRRVVAALEAAVGRVRGQQRADREASGEPLGDGDGVGLHTCELGAEPRAAAADAGLHLVVEQQRAVAIAELARELEPGGVDRPDAALALDRLDQHGAGAGADRRRERGEVVARDVLEARGHGLERLALGCRPAGGERRQRAPVEGALDAHDLVLGRAAARPPGAARELDGGLDRLGARVAEERAVVAGQRAQALGERDRGLAVEEVRDVPEHGSLRGQRLRCGRVAVPERADGEAGDEVEVGRPVLVPDRACRRRARARAAARDRSAAARLRRDRAGSRRHHRTGDADADARHAAEQRRRAGLELGQHAAARARRRARGGDLREHGAPLVEHAGHVGEEDELVRRERRGDGGRRVVGVDVERRARAVDARAGRRPARGPLPSAARISPSRTPVGSPTRPSSGVRRASTTPSANASGARPGRPQRCAQLVRDGREALADAREHRQRR